MANEARIAWLTGRNLYGIVFRVSDNYVWYAAGSAWESWGTGGRTIADYASMTFSEVAANTCRYAASFPAAITTAGLYDVEVRVRIGSAPASNDTIAGMLEIDWRGYPVTAAVTPPAQGIGQMVLEIQTLTGRVGDTELVTTARCVRWANEAQFDIASVCPGHVDLEYKHATAVTLLDATYSYSLTGISPTILYFLRAYYMDGASSYELDYKKTEDFDYDYPSPSDLTGGRPTTVTKRGKTLEIVPVPTSGEAGHYLRLDYTKRPTSFVTDSLTATCDMEDADEGIIQFGVSRAFKAIGGDKLSESDRYMNYYLAWREGYREKKDGLMMSALDELFA